MILKVLLLGEVIELIFLFEIKDAPGEIGQGFVPVLHDFLQGVEPGFAEAAQ